MKVKFRGKIYEARRENEYYILDDGSVAAAIDCEEVKEEKPKAAKKKKDT